MIFLLLPDLAVESICIGNGLRKPKPRVLFNIITQNAVAHTFQTKDLHQDTLLDFIAIDSVDSLKLACCFFLHPFHSLKCLKCSPDKTITTALWKRQSAIRYTHKNRNTIQKKNKQNACCSWIWSAANKIPWFVPPAISRKTLTVRAIVLVIENYAFSMYSIASAST